jgi:membrane protease YdiL (CAAX protease family)
MKATATARAVAGPVGAPWHLWGAVVVLMLLAGVGAAATSPVLGLNRVWVLLVLAPVLEEAVFRAGLQDALLRRWNAPLAANVVTALAFGLVHAAVRGDAAGFAVAAPALLIGAVYARWRQLRLCVALHAVMNALWLAWNLIGPAASLGS